MDLIAWHEIQNIATKAFRCGYCGNSVAPERGWRAVDPRTGDAISFIHVCHHCNNPTFHDEKGQQHPGVPFGETVKGINDDSVEALYEEARMAMSVGSFTAVVLSCRKLLMHIAVAKGANAGENFVSYVQYLADNHYIPPDAKLWVDHIRERGNEANHEINIMTHEDAELLLSFSQMLLKVIYEFPSAIKQRTAGNDTPA